jgi:hypothetical protein
MSMFGLSEELADQPEQYHHKTYQLKPTISPRKLEQLMQRRPRRTDSHKYQHRETEQHRKQPSCFAKAQ